MFLSRGFRVSLIFLFLLGAAAIVGLRAADPSPNGLALTIDIAQMDPSSDKTANIFLHILNTSDHEITVLTKGLDFSHDSVDGVTSKVWTCTIGYAGMLKHEGHVVVPSLSDLGPVTLQPNEEALATYELDGEDVPGLIKNKTPIEVTYSISDAWSQRLKIWGGMVQAKPVSIGLFK